MPFITPAVAAVITVAATAGVTIYQVEQQKKAKRAREADELQQKADQARKSELLSDKENRAQRRRASGSGQRGTILGGGSGSSTEIGRATLLGQ